MSDPGKSEQTPSQPDFIERFHRVREQFKAAWRRVLSGGPPPAIETYLRDKCEEERSALLGELQKLDRQYRERLACSQCAVSGSTLDFDLPARQAETPPSASSHTIDFFPDAPVDPVATSVLGSPCGANAEVDLLKAEDFSQTGSATIDAPNRFPEVGVTLSLAVAPASDLLVGDFALAESVRARPAADYPSVDGHVISGELGRGGMGVVYKARQTALKRLVALNRRQLTMYRDRRNNMRTKQSTS